MRRPRHNLRARSEVERSRTRLTQGAFTSETSSEPNDAFPDLPRARSHDPPTIAPLLDRSRLAAIMILGHLAFFAPTVSSDHGTRSDLRPAAS
jgi:hypothetical protein